MASKIHELVYTTCAYKMIQSDSYFLSIPLQKKYFRNPGYETSFFIVFIKNNFAFPDQFINTIGNGLQLIEPSFHQTD
jgi:hypothetical protein